MTSYTVLYATESAAGEQTWAKASDYEAHNPEAAIAAHVRKQDITEGTFVAVPARSWNPRTIETAVRVTFK